MVYVVRHAEKADGSRDTELSAAGHARALALVQALEGEEIDAIFVTEFRRTMQTAMPLAEARGIEPRVIEAAGGDADGHVDRVVGAVRARGEGARVLVVGHSNTVPLILSALGVREAITIEEEDFGRLYVVRRAELVAGVGDKGRDGERRVELVVRRFGE